MSSSSFSSSKELRIMNRKVVTIVLDQARPNKIPEYGYEGRLKMKIYGRHYVGV